MTLILFISDGVSICLYLVLGLVCVNDTNNDITKCI